MPLGDMVVRIVGSNAEFDKAVDTSQKKFKSFGDFAKKTGQSLSLFVTTPIIAAGAAALKSAGQMQMYQASFETMLGSTEKANQLMTDFQKLAAKTPFEFTDLAEAGKQLLQFNIPAEKLLPTLQQLGDVAQGNGQRFQSLSLAFGQMSAAGRLMGQDLLQMINAGFNPLQEISKQTGESMLELKKKMEKGQISAEMVADAFATATAEGGKFFGGMEKASKTLPGLLSTLNDDVMTMARSFANFLIPAVMDTVKSLSALAQKFTAMSDEQKKTILTIAAVVASIGPLLLGISKTVDVVKNLGVAFTFLAAHPVVAALIAIGAALAVIIPAAIKNTKEFEKFNEVLKGGTTGELPKDLELITDKLETMQKALEEGNARGFDTTPIKAQIDELEKRRAEIQAQLDVEANAAAQRARWQEMDARAQAEINKLATQESLTQEQITAQIQERARIAKLVEDRTTAEADTAKQLSILQDKVKAGLLDQSVVAEETRAIYMKEIDALLEMGYRVDQVSIGADRLRGLIAAVNGDWLKAKENQTDALQENVDADTEYFQNLINGIVNANEREIEEEKKTLEEKKKLREEYNTTLYNGTVGVVQAIQQLMDGATKNEIDRLTDQMEKELQIRGLAEKTQKEMLQDKLKDAQAAGDKEKELELKKEIERLAITEKYQKLAAEIEYKNALNQWNINRAMTVAAGIRSTMETFKNAGGWPLGVLPAAMMGAITAAQLALLQTNKPQRMAEGGIINPRANGVNVIAAEAGQPEIFAPLDKLNEFIAERPGFNPANDGNIELTVQLDSGPILKKIFPATKNRQVLIHQGAIIK